MSAKALAASQRVSDRAHHQKRIEWLQGSEPVWACGTRVLPSDRQTLLAQSQEYLSNPSGHFNCCQCEPRCA